MTYGCSHCGIVSDLLTVVLGEGLLGLNSDELVEGAEAAGAEASPWWEPVDLLIAATLELPSITGAWPLFINMFPAWLSARLAGFVPLPGLVLQLNSEASSSAAPQRVRARRAILTVPVGVLKHSLSSVGHHGVNGYNGDEVGSAEDTIVFDPPLPPYVVASIEAMGVTTPMKVVLCWPMTTANATTAAEATAPDFDLQAWIRSANDGFDAGPLAAPPSWFVQGEEPPAATDSRRGRGSDFGSGAHIEVLNWGTLTGGSNQCLVVGVEGSLAHKFTTASAAHPYEQRGSNADDGVTLRNGVYSFDDRNRSEVQSGERGVLGIVRYLLSRLDTRRSHMISRAPSAAPLPFPVRVALSPWGGPFSRGGYGHQRIWYDDDDETHRLADGRRDPPPLQPWHSPSQHRLGEFSLDRRVYIAGEHTSADSFGSVQGAAETGMAAAMRVLVDKEEETVLAHVFAWLMLSSFITAVVVMSCCVVVRWAV